jgi:hypothetical protein
MTEANAVVLYSIMPKVASGKAFGGDFGATSVPSGRVALAISRGLNWVGQTRPQETLRYAS